MAQTAHTSQFGTKVWDARRVELPVDGQSTTKPNESLCRLGCELKVRSREHARHRHAISLPRRCCPGCCPTRHPCCPIAESVVRAVHLLARSGARSGRLDELVDVCGQTSDGLAAANPHRPRTGVIAPSNDVSRQAVDVDPGQQLERRLIK